MFTFPASARTLVAAQVHTGGVVRITLSRVNGGAVGEDWNPYSWTATSIREA
jgi:hypothetical protein